MGRISHVTSLATSVAIASLLGACTSDTNRALFGSSPDSGTAERGGGNSQGGSSGVGGGVGGIGGASSGGATTQTESGGATGMGAAGSAPTGGATGMGAAGSAPTGGATAAGGAGAAAGGSGSAKGGDTGAGGRTNGNGGSEGGTTSRGGARVDAGTDAGESADSGAGGAPPVVRSVRCGDTSCDANAGEYCCIRDAAAVRPMATCTKNATSCDRIFRCDSDADCNTGEHCCLDFTYSPTMPSSSCSAHVCESPLACSVPDDCATGQTCCGAIGTVPMVGVKYTRVTCEASCTGMATPFCVDDSPCNSSTSCQQSLTLPPGYLVCR